MTDNTLLNDVHSRLNPTRVARVERPESVDALRVAVLRARAEGRRVSVSGGLHAMGGQQFASGEVCIDLRGLDAVLDTDAEKGWLRIGAGAQWPAIIAATRAMPPGSEGAWAIRQKQTGVDDVTLAGSISANAHGRGLLMRPFGEDIEALTLMNAEGALIRCSREENARLFSLVIGGFGLFGILVDATLRLTPRRRVRRLVDIIDIDDAANAVFRRAEQGCLYGDFQFVIDAGDDGFLRRGVFSCYRPVEEQGSVEAATSDLAKEDWLRLMRLAHSDKRTAFRLYSRHYLETDGAVYDSDTMQLSTYIPSYAEFVAGVGADATPGAVRESLVIGEHYVPRERALEFMDRARAILRAFGTEVIYGTIRSILRDETAVLPWAREDYACVIFNLRTPHDEAGRRHTEATFRALTDASIALGGSFFLTYHRAATPEQVLAAYPRFEDWLSLKKEYDPEEFFTSDWYRHYRDAFAARKGPHA